MRLLPSNCSQTVESATDVARGWWNDVARLVLYCTVENGRILRVPEGWSPLYILYTTVTVVCVTVVHVGHNWCLHDDIQRLHNPKQMFKSKTDKCWHLCCNSLIHPPDSHKHRFIRSPKKSKYSHRSKSSILGHIIIPSTQDSKGKYEHGFL